MSEPIVERPAMSDYGVPETPDGALPWSWARDRLVTSRNYWVITASPDGRPAAMPVWGVWIDAPDDEGSFWFSCAPSSRKARNIAANPKVVVAADATVEVVSVDGTARLLQGSDAGDAVDAYVAKYWPGEDPEPHAAFLNSHSIYAVTPDRAYGIIEREDEFAQKATRWRWVR
jgi:general stress protein 26